MEENREGNRREGTVRGEEKRRKGVYLYGGVTTDIWVDEGGKINGWD
jgi:hypothetical protein